MVPQLPPPPRQDHRTAPPRPGRAWPAPRPDSRDRQEWSRIRRDCSLVRVLRSCSLAMRAAVLWHGPQDRLRRRTSRSARSGAAGIRSKRQCRNCRHRRELPNRDPDFPSDWRVAAGHRQSPHRRISHCLRIGPPYCGASPRRRTASSRRHPVVEISPPGVARSNAVVSQSTSPQVARPCTQARRAAGSTRTARMFDKSIIMPPSQTAWRATPCPPPRTATVSPWSRAKSTAAITSATPSQRTIKLGRRSIIPFQTRRAASYSASPGRRIRPRKVWLSARMADSSGNPPKTTFATMLCPLSYVMPVAGADWRSCRHWRRDTKVKSASNRSFRSCPMPRGKSAPRSSSIRR